MNRLALGVLASLLLGLACGPAAAPAPAVASPSSATQALPSAPTSDAGYRQQVVDAARAEGQVNAALHTSWTPEGIQRLEDIVEREYGVRLKVNFQPIVNYGQRSSELLAEVGAGATPSFDVYQISDLTSVVLRQAGAVEVVNWAPLVPAGTPPGIVAGEGAYVVVYTDHFGLMSDPTTIADAEVPRSLKELANPKWRGKVLLFISPTVYWPWVIRLGRDEALAAALAGPAGQRLESEVVAVGNRYYADTREHTLEQEALAAGFPSFTWAESPDAVAFVLSPEGEEVQRELERIFQGG